MTLTEARKVKVGSTLHLGEIVAPIFKITRRGKMFEFHIHAPDHVWFEYTPTEPLYVS